MSSSFVGDIVEETERVVAARSGEARSGEARSGKRSGEARSGGSGVAKRIPLLGKGGVAAAINKKDAKLP